MAVRARTEAKIAGIRFMEEDDRIILDRIIFKARKPKLNGKLGQFEPLKHWEPLKELNGKR
jgi:hypothetical protein